METRDIKTRRKALGWDRTELAHRAGVDRSVMQLIELGQWSEEESLLRVERCLAAGEAALAASNSSEGSD